MTVVGCTTRGAPSTLAAWVNEMATLTEARNLIWCDGSEEERARLTAQAVAAGILMPLNQRKRPGCYLHRSHPSDVSRTEELTFVCTPSRDEAGPTNNWMDPGETQRRLRAWLAGAYRGRTMYAVPYVLGPVGSPLAKPGVQLTDSLYVVLSLRIMTRMGSPAADLLRTTDDFQRGMHCTLECDAGRRLICHFPQDNMVWSVGSNYGGNALLSKKCFGLRIASYLGRKEGWLAEHMLILGLESPQGETTYIAGAFPSACGKTNLAMLTPPSAFKGWRVFTVGDDIAWMRVDPDGRMWAVNPEAGYFGVAPGTSARSNPNATEMIRSNTIFTNVALTRDGDVWWEGMETDAPAGMLDWQGRPWDQKSGQTAAHPNSRFTCPMTNNPAYTPEANGPRGVPISAIIFGGRRATTIPLLLESFDWAHGVYLGATMGSETTAAATGKVGIVRRDPMAMLPFCGYNVADYISHWLGMRSKLVRPPKIFMVNWFRKDGDGSFLWPGYGENMRILKWIVERIQGRVGAEQTAVGLVPRKRDLDLTGLDITAARLDEALAIKREEWAVELRLQEEFFDRIDADLPRELEVQRAALAAALDL
jgi:phosphoenolpyruvate carboxykinase (GTP)